MHVTVFRAYEVIFLYRNKLSAMATSDGIWRELPGEKMGAWRRTGSRGLHGGGSTFELGCAREPGFLQELLRRV